MHVIKPFISILALVTSLVPSRNENVQKISATKTRSILPESSILLDPKPLDKLNFGETESNQLIRSVFCLWR